MRKDFLTWFMFGGGLFLLICIIYVEFTKMSWWVDDPNHDLALPLLLGMAIAAIYYAHSRIDSLEHNKKLDDIQSQLNKLQQDVTQIKSDLKKLN